MPVAAHHTRRLSAAQLPLIAPDLWSTEIIPRLPPNLEAQACTLHAIQRYRAFTCAGDLLRALLAYVLAPYSFAALGAWAVLQDIADISPTAWRKCLSRANPWLGWLLSTLLAHPTINVPLARGRRIRLIDATRLRQWRGTGDDWRVHLSYNVSVGHMDQVVVTDRHGAERLQHASVQPGDVCVAKAGFGIRANVAFLHAQGADGILRVYPPIFQSRMRWGNPLILPRGCQHQVILICVTSRVGAATGSSASRSACLPSPFQRMSRQPSVGGNSEKLGIKAGRSAKQSYSIWAWSCW